MFRRTDSLGASRIAEAALAVLLAGVILAVIAAIVTPEYATPAAGTLALLAGCAGVFLVRRGQRIVSCVLAIIGITALAAAWSLGVEYSPVGLLSLNQDLIGMLAAVSLMGTAITPIERVSGRLTGTAAVWRTAAFLHLLGGIINLSALSIIGDRLKGSTGLHRGDALLLTRVYTTAAFWSPFWVGSAAASALAPGANLWVVLVVGFTLACVTIAATMPSTLCALGESRRDYVGYPISWVLMRVPLLLVLAVMALHLALPAVPVPRLVTLVSLIVFLVATLRRAGRRAFLADCFRTSVAALPGTRGETVLFVGAGLLGIGLSALLKTVEWTIPLPGYGALEAWGGVVIMTVVSLLGIHPLVSMSLVAALIGPLNPEPTLFVSSAIIAWGLSAASGPISGIQMFMQGRYGVSPLETTRGNIGFLLTGLALTGPALFTVGWWAQSVK